MGTWATSPFGSDTALDVIDVVVSYSPEERLDFIERTLVSAVQNGESSEDPLPDETLAVAAILAANLPGGAELPWNEDAEGVDHWLTKPVHARYSALAVEAIEAALPPEGWWRRSWVDASDRREFDEALGRLLVVLRAAAQD
ncbi:DUF4259 domain-containing protein [Saccharopolyspora terrae]|uniref:DUF4259 domain-containing protein n=1 Tax=Saccharopolyspora terrae TaxID=2530384 RepID=UPI00140509A1|nr:DUF4259 domain-containing protein [Saccharopolyspora terrae]